MIIKKMFILLVLPLLLIIGSCSFISNDMVDSNEELATRLMVPKNAEIVLAELCFNVVYETVDSTVVDLYRVTDPWNEFEVTWGNFAGAYDSSVVVDSVTVDGPGLYSFDIKGYLEDWIAGRFTHYGMILDQIDTDGYVKFASRENSDITLHPYIKVSFSVYDENEKQYVTLTEEEELTADAYIWEYSPDYNGGSSSYLYTGIIGAEKQTLVDFLLEEEVDIVGTGTPGYWKNHPEAWPVVDTISIGGVLYTVDSAIDKMMIPIRQYKWYTMFNSLVAAKLNVLLGTDDTVVVDADGITIADIIEDADFWLANTSLKESKANNDPWQIDGEYINTILDDYNNGLLGVPARD